MYLVRNTKRRKSYCLSFITIDSTFSNCKKIKKFNIVLEVEEIYTDVGKYSKLNEKKENLIFEVADKYIFSTITLNERVNKNNKPYVVCNGIYKLEERLVERFSDGKIHIVYSGVIDTLKKGAFNAANTALYLDDRYHIHIIGFGNEVDIEKLKNLIVIIRKQDVN